jgi:hypothetical protein
VACRCRSSWRRTLRSPARRQMRPKAPVIVSGWSGCDQSSVAANTNLSWSSGDVAERGTVLETLSMCIKHRERLGVERDPAGGASWCP